MSSRSATNRSEQQAEPSTQMRTHPVDETSPVRRRSRRSGRPICHRWHTLSTTPPLIRLGSPATKRQHPPGSCVGRSHHRAAAPSSPLGRPNVVPYMGEVPGMRAFAHDGRSSGALLYIPGQQMTRPRALAWIPRPDPTDPPSGSSPSVHWRLRHHTRDAGLHGAAYQPFVGRSM